MPLYAEDRKGFVTDGFNAIVIGTPLIGDQTLAQGVDALVMSTVDCGGVPVQGIEPGIFPNHGGMVTVPILISMVSGSGKILGYGSAKSHIDQLHSFADAKNRYSFLDA